MNRPDKRAVLALQGAYYILSGAFPLVSRRGFEAVTGKKEDWWLVQMVALLAITSGAGILFGLEENAEEINFSTVALSTMAAISFTAIDVAYAFKRKISPVYLLDAVAEIAILGLLHSPD